MNIGELLPEMRNMSVYYLGSMMGPEVKHHRFSFGVGQPGHWNYFKPKEINSQIKVSEGTSSARTKLTNRLTGPDICSAEKHMIKE